VQIDQSGKTWISSYHNCFSSMVLAKADLCVCLWYEITNIRQKICTCCFAFVHRMRGKRLSPVQEAHLCVERNADKPGLEKKFVSDEIGELPVTVP
jgi:hypothetical protein